MSDDLTHHHILLYKGDYARLQSIYTTKKASSVIRDLVRLHCDTVETKLMEKRDARAVD